MSYYDRDRRSTARLRRLFVGNLNRHVRERDIKDLFSKLGRLQDYEIVDDFAFVEYEDARDAADAIKEFDGTRLEGDRIIVEYARKGPATVRGARGRSDGRCYNCGEVGHIARECDIPKGRGDRAMRFEESRCFDCGQPGHLARDCNERRRGRSPRSYSRSPRRGRSRSPRRSSGGRRSSSRRRYDDEDDDRDDDYR